MLGHRLRATRERGDTIIEVLFAITIFSLLVVGTLSIMNQGSDIAERSLETTLVRSEIDGQVNALRFLHDAYITAYNATAGAPAIAPSNNATSTPAERWQYVVTRARTSIGSSIQCTDASRLPNTPSAFSINPSTMDVVTSAPIPAPVYARFESNKAEGLWVEAVGPSPASGGTRYIDFYVSACWDSVGQSIPMTIGTMVRLYEPAS